MWWQNQTEIILNKCLSNVTVQGIKKDYVCCTMRHQSDRRKNDKGSRTSNRQRILLHVQETKLETKINWISSRWDTSLIRGEREQPVRQSEANQQREKSNSLQWSIFILPRVLTSNHSDIGYMEPPRSAAISDNYDFSSLAL